MDKNPYFFYDDAQKVYGWDEISRKYDFVGYYSTFGIDDNTLMAEKINLVIMYGIE